MSLSKAKAAAISVEYPPNSIRMIAKRNGSIVMIGSRKKHNICELTDMKASKRNASEHVLFTAGKDDGMTVMRKRMCHAGVSILENMVKLGAAEGLEELKSQDVKYNVCEACCAGKATAVPHKRKEKNQREILELVHTDVIGPVEPTSIDGDKYALAVLDDASGAVWGEVMCVKSRVPDSIKSIIEAAENKAGKRIVSVRSDRAKEYVCKELKDYYSVKGIGHQPTPPYSPESNGRAERLNCTIVEKARAILEEMRMLTGINDYQKLWSEAFLTVIYVHNRTLTDSTQKSLRGKTPYEIITGRKPDLSHLRVFGCKVKVQKPKRYMGGKFDSKVWDGIHVGYDGADGAYRIYVPRLRRVLVSRDVTFQEKLIRPVPLLSSEKQGVEISDSDSDLEDATTEVNITTDIQPQPERFIARN